MIILRYFYIVYFFGLMIALISSFSKFYYSKGKLSARVLDLLKNIMFCPLYPLSLFSKEGRKRFTNFINKF